MYLDVHVYYMYVHVVLCLYHLCFAVYTALDHPICQVHVVSITQIHVFINHSQLNFRTGSEECNIKAELPPTKVCQEPHSPSSAM